MPRPQLLSSVFVTMALVFAVAGCSGTTDTPQGETGSLSLDLVIADGIVIDEVEWWITGNEMEMHGDIDVSAPGSTASVEVFGLPPGDEDYTVMLTATSVDKEVTCKGSADFNVEIGETTPVLVVLNCKLPRRFGSVRVNGEFNICAELVKMVVSPLRTSNGNDNDLRSEAVDRDDDDIFTLWTNDGDAFGDPTAESTTYTCLEVGIHEITVSVTDNDEFCDMATWTVPVTCVPGDGLECVDDEDCDKGEICNDNNECVPEVECNENEDCDTGEICLENKCVPDLECIDNEDCDPGDICFDNECRSDPDLFCDTGLCVENAALRAECVEKFLLCLADNVDEEECVVLSIAICTECNTGLDCGDDNECTDNVCTAGVCSNPNNDNMCNDGAGTCNEGVCEPTSPACEYEQDFEGLGLPVDDSAALENDGWRIFANVFQPDGTTYIRGYGGGPAPNGGDGYSAVVAGEGGAAQGDQQLSIYGDYINQPDQTAGNVIESNVYQERTIVAGEVGNTYTFTSDFKRGNIAGASTALAFIKTLDPNAGYVTTNFITEDTTNADTNWNTLSIQITIDAGLVGQLLQYGFQNTSSNNEGSGIFYDNVTFGPQGCGGDNGGGGPSGELTINGDFETGDGTGWSDFSGAGATFTVTDTQENGGVYSGNLAAGQASVALVKQANIGIGTVQPESTVEISFDLLGSLSGDGGVVIVEFFSELSGGGVSKSEILFGPPNFPAGTWTSYSYTVTTGNDVSGGVTLQLKAECGAVAGCGVDAYFDNVSVTVP